MTNSRYQTVQHLLETYDKGIFDDFVKWEILRSIVRKVDEHLVYGSRGFRRPKSYGVLVLRDFGSAVRGDGVQSHGIQSNQFRCPELPFNRNCSYPADIWNVGVMASSFHSLGV